MKTMRLTAAIFLSFILLIVISFLYIHLFKPEPINAVSPNIVISEIQISGDLSTDEFVELYNPNSTEVSINGWRLTKKTGAGSEYILISTLSGSIQPHKYFLISHLDYNDTTVSADRIFDENTISSNNTVFLYSDGGMTVVDKVGMGSGAIEEEGSHTSSPDDNRSVERKANASSTKISMETEGVDEFAGNGYDSDNNSADFIYRTYSNPQNSNSTEEPQISPTLTPSIEPTVSPTTEPTPTPTEEPTPTPTNEITPTPTTESTPTPEPTPATSPTPTTHPTSTPTPQIYKEIIFPSITLRCYIKPILIQTGLFSISFPRLSCATH